MTDLSLRHFGNEGNPVLILLHGVTDDGGCWPDAIARFEQDWHVVAVDLRGHGRSPRFTESQLMESPGTMLQDVLGVLERHRPAVVVGHSLGGLLALRAAVARPDLVTGLVLEDPAKPQGRSAWSPEYGEGLLQMVEEATNGAEAVKPQSDDRVRWSDAEITGWRAAKHLVDKEYLRRGFWFGDDAWEELFNCVQVPTLVVGPQDGPMMPDARQVRNPLVRLETIRGAGHCVRRDEPEVFHNLVDPFLGHLGRP